MAILDDWRGIPARIEFAAAGRELDRPATEDMTLREVVHHLVEGNVVAASILVAALGSPGCTYDWSWMQPFGPWMDRLSYRSQPVGPALALCRALNAWVAALLESLPDALGREVLLLDAPGAAPRRATVADVLQQEVDHLREHLGG